MDTIRRICSSLRGTSRKLVRLEDGGPCVRYVAQGAAEVLAVPCLWSSSGPQRRCRCSVVPASCGCMCCAPMYAVSSLVTSAVWCSPSGFWMEFRRDLPHPDPAVRTPGHARSAGADWQLGELGDDGEAGLKPPVSGVEDQDRGPSHRPTPPAVVVGIFDVAPWPPASRRKLWNSDNLMHYYYPGEQGRLNSQVRLQLNTNKTSPNQ